MDVVSTFFFLITFQISTQKPYLYIFQIPPCWLCSLFLARDIFEVWFSYTDCKCGQDPWCISESKMRFLGKKLHSVLNLFLGHKFLHFHFGYISLLCNLLLITWAISYMFTKWKQMLEPLGLRDFVGFSESSDGELFSKITQGRS